MDRNIFEITLPPNKDDYAPCSCLFVRTFPFVEKLAIEIPRHLAMGIAVQCLSDGFNIVSDKWEGGTHYLKLLQWVAIEDMSFGELNDILDMLPRIGKYERRLNVHLDNLDDKRWFRHRYMQAA